ncbi:MAG: PhoH family protein [Phycisphaerales bacterium]|nr:PhoH family protein [Phycisphaerales bacterium]
MEITVRIPVAGDWVRFAGPADSNLKLVREAVGVTIAARDGVVQLAGQEEPVCIAKAVIDRMVELAARGHQCQPGEVQDLIADETEDQAVQIATMDEPELRPVSWEGDLEVYSAGRRIRPRTNNQLQYVEAIRHNDLVFGSGPAGTGKTYLAVACAVHMLKADRVRKIMLVRPAVEAGEKLGFLPGDLEAKVHPYLRPLLDALHDMLEFNTIRRFMETDVLEIAPLAYMRGRTLNHSVIILDEAQNTTAAQMKMFLTRLGHGSKMIVTGDTSQIDLSNPAHSGLIDAARRFKDVPGSAFIRLQNSDVVRHPLVQRIIEAYQVDGPHH